MRLGRQEKEVRNLIHEHLSMVDKCVEVTLQALKVYAAGDVEKAEELRAEASRVEEEADLRRRQIARKLFEGAFLPMMREPLLDFVKESDRVADAAEQVCKRLTLTRIEIPESFRADVTDIAGNATSSLKLLRDAFEAVFSNIADVLDLVHQCTAVEHFVDGEMEAVVRRIFASDLPLAHKVQLAELIDEIDDIVDLTEEAADVLEMLTVVTSV